MAKSVTELRCEELRAILTGTITEALRYVEGHVWEPEAGSEAAAELGNTEAGPVGPWGDQPVRTAYALANAGITGVLDQLSALVILTQPVSPALATTVVSRSAIEIGSGVWWLMEPGIGVRARVARCGAEEMRSALRAKQAATKLGGGPDLQDYIDQNVRVRARLDGLGLAIVGNGFTPSVEGEEQGDATALTTECLGELLGAPSSVIYHVYSAVSHGTQYGLFQHFVEDPSSPGHLIWTSLLPVMEASVQAAIVATMVSVDRIIEVMGWDARQWNAWKPHIGAAFP